MTENKKPTLGPFSRTHVAVCCILAAGTMWGCQGLPSRALAGLGMPALPIMVLRDLGGAALLALLFLLTDRAAFRVRLRELPLLALMGMSGVLGMNLLYYRSQQVSSLAVAAILLYTAPSIVVLFSTLIWKDPLTKRKLCALGLAFLGCSFVAGLFNGSLSLSVQGLLLGLGSALTYASYTLFGQKALTCMMLFATVLPYVLYTKALAWLDDSGKAAILASVEPVVAALLGIVAFGEPLTLGVALGLVCVLGAVVLLK